VSSLGGWETPDAKRSVPNCQFRAQREPAGRLPRTEAQSLLVVDTITLAPVHRPLLVATSAGECSQMPTTTVLTLSSQVAGPDLNQYIDG